MSTRLPLEHRAHPVAGETLRRSLVVITISWIFGNVWNMTGTGAAFTLVFPSPLIVRTTAPESAI